MTEFDTQDQELTRVSRRTLLAGAGGTALAAAIGAKFAVSGAQAQETEVPEGSPPAKPP